jgi:hypothetical protein
MNVIKRITEALDEQTSRSATLQTALDAFSSSMVTNVLPATATTTATASTSSSSSFTTLGDSRRLLTYSSAAQFDQQIADALKQCSEQANELKRMIAESARTSNEQRHEHLSRVVHFIYSRLADCSSRWSVMRAARYKQMMQLQRPLLDM